MRANSTLLETGQIHVEMRNVLTKQDMAYFSLYWDKIISPKNYIIGNIIPFESELEKTGVLSLPMAGPKSFPSKNSISGNPVLDSYFEVATERLNDKDIDWTLLQLGKELYLPKELEKKVNSVKVELLNALPVPIIDTSIEGILEFKEKRKDEFVYFHNCLDALYFDILNSPDQDLTLKKSISEIANSLKNIDSISKEKYKTIPYNLSVELNIDGTEILKGVRDGIIIFGALGGNIMLGAIVGGFISSVKFKGKASVAFTPALKNSKYSYLSEAVKEGIISQE
mgnify:CR=1 FL=1